MTDKNSAGKPASDIIFRYALFLTGLFIASMGVAFSTKAGLGTSPVASLPYSVSLVFGALSFGGWLNVLSVIQISVQVALLRKKCKPVEIAIQTVLAFVYGYLTNLSCFLIKSLEVKNYGWQLFYMFLGCIVLAFGIWIQLKGNVAMLPGEAMNRAISTVTGRRYENIKIFFDIFYIAASAVICLVFLHELKGVREGSIIAAVLVGNIIKFYQFLFQKLCEEQTKAEIKVKFYDTADDSLLKFAVIISKSDGKWVFCKHKERNTFEEPGGHRESGESIEETAKRELMEETGALEFSIKPVCVYSVTGRNRVNNTGGEMFGMLYFAEITKFEKELHSEMEKVFLSDTLPSNWTYPLIQPKLIEEAARRGFL